MIYGEYFDLLYARITNKDNLTTKSLLVALAAVASSYYFFKWIRMARYFRKFGLRGPTPKPLVGNVVGLVSRGFHVHDEYIFKKYKSNIVGYFEVTDAVILCKDVDMFKSVMIKDFHNFVNRRKFESLSIDPFCDFLTVLRDDEWKNVRSIVSTTFTSAKLKQMFELMEPCVDSYMDYLNMIQKNDKTFDAKDSLQKLTFDTICSCCFGMQTDSINNPDDPFITELKKLLNTQLSFSLLIAVLFPRLTKILGKWKIFEIIPSKSLNFFKEFVKATILKRDRKEQVRNDFIQMMIDHEENENHLKFEDDKKKETTDGNVRWKLLKKTLSNSEILAQAMLFLIAGSETTATTMSFLCYLLAKNPDIQKRLTEDIENAYKEYGKINYEMVNSIEYLDMVIDETLRLFPPAVRIDRECAAEYKYKDMTIPKGTIWTGCIWALHHDPSIYPEPEKFDPERFSTEGKKTRDNCAFIPFGAGPRNCVGLRFALLEIKLFVCKALLKYQFVVCKETTDKIEINTNGATKSKVPIILKVCKKN